MHPSGRGSKSPKISDRSRSPSLRGKSKPFSLETAAAGSDRGENDSSDVKRGDRLDLMTGNSLDRASSGRSAAVGMQNFNEEAFQECIRKATENNKASEKQNNPKSKAKEGLDIIRIVNKKNPARAREIFGSYMQLNDQIEVSRVE